MEVSIGDFVLSGGELPALAMTEAVVRLLPGVLGDEASARDESFTTGLLEGPQYTRPREFRGLEVPAVLFSGNHAAIAAWRREAAHARTRERRSDLLDGRGD
jgi:tRNA (guanine37-N1)-methyltransferase